MHGRWFAAGLVLASGLLASAPAALGGGFTMTSFGGRRAGMLSNLGCPDEPTALVHNPAGLADQPGVQVYLYLAPTFLNLQMKMKAHDPDRFPEINPAHCGSAGQDPCPWPVDDQGYYAPEIEPERYFGILPYLGLTTDLGFLGRAGRKAVLAAAVYAPNFYGAYFPADAPSAYNFIGGAFVVGAATLGAGYRVNRHFAVGANLSYHYMYLSMAQKLSVASTLTPAGQQPDGLAKLAQGAVGDLRLDFEGTDHGVGWNVSVLINPVPWIGVGLGYSGATSPSFDGAVSFTPQKEGMTEARFSELVGLLGYQLPDRLTLQMVIPPAINVGLHLRPLRWLELGLDLRLWLYNLYKRQVLTPSYAPGGTGKQVITEDALSRDKQYHPSYQLTLGGLVRPLASLPDLELMAGLGYDHSPIPDQTFTIDNPSLSQVKLTIGARWWITPSWRVSLSYMLIFFLARDIQHSQTSPPTNVKGSGLSHTPSLAVTWRF